MKRVVGFLLGILVLSLLGGYFVRDVLVVTLACDVILLLFKIGSTLGRAARNRRYRATAPDRLVHEAELRAGPTVLEGKVAYAAFAELAMQMDVTQLGSESESSGSWSHEWKEIERKLTVQPFYLLRDQGERVRVEPPPGQSQLFDEFSRKVLVEARPAIGKEGATGTRVCTATLLPSEHVWVVGRLERGHDPEGAPGGYRQQEQGWVMRGDPTLLVSSVHLGDHFGARARMHLRHALVLLGAVGAPATLLARVADRALGETREEAVEGSVPATDEDNDVIGHDVTVRGAAGLMTLRADEPPTRSTLSVRHGRWSANLGNAAHVTHDEATLVVFSLVLTVAARYAVNALAHRAMPWYRTERRLVVESGSGRLTFS